MLQAEVDNVIAKRNERLHLAKVRRLAAAEKAEKQAKKLEEQISKLKARLSD
jgi:hypothetical protein